MDRSSRSELLQTIASQQEQLGRYEKRLRDVVEAYKSLHKEKAALEATIQALSCSKNGGDKAKKGTESSYATRHSGEHVQDPLGAQDPKEDESKDKTDGADDREEGDDQVATLTTSLQTLMQEKTKMETNYQAEKKKMRAEYDERIKRLKEELEQKGEKEASLQEQLLQLKNRLRSDHEEREKEQNDHAVMLRELQKLLADERNAKEHLENQLDDTKELLADSRRQQPELEHRYEKRITDLSKELEHLRSQLKASDEKSDQPSPLLLELQKEMAEMKAQYKQQVQQEQKRANEAESRLGQIAQQGEERVCGLENKLSELSETVGNYERLRYQDQIAIQKLKDRIAQLDMENSALTRAVHSEVTDEDERNMDVQGLADKIGKLKDLLKMANEKSENPINVQELFLSGIQIDDDSLHKRCHEELGQLKEEFERYKLRAQSVLKNKSAKDTANNQEVESYKSQIAELKDRIRQQRADKEEMELDYKQQVAGLQRTLAQMAEAHKADLASTEMDHQQKMTSLEQQIQKQRDRTVALLAEKDREIDQLRCSIPGWRPTERQGSLGSEENETEESVAVENLLSQFPSSLQNEGTLLHFAQEQARKVVENSTLRKQKHQAEQALREVQQSFMAKEEHYVEQIEFLKEEVRKYERSKSRESANLEYLKNVVYNYMICRDSVGKQQMLNAIATILQFSPKEKQRVQKHLTAWWGYYTSYSSTK